MVEIGFPNVHFSTKGGKRVEIVEQKIGKVGNPRGFPPKVEKEVGERVEKGVEKRVEKVEKGWK